jgi:hypothetical protein
MRMIDMDEELKQLRDYRKRLILLTAQCEAAIARRMSISFMFPKTHIPITRKIKVNGKNRRIWMADEATCKRK